MHGPKWNAVHAPLMRAMFCPMQGRIALPSLNEAMYAAHGGQCEAML